MSLSTPKGHINVKVFHCLPHIQNIEFPSISRVYTVYHSITKGILDNHKQSFLLLWLAALYSAFASKQINFLFCFISILKIQRNR